MKQISECNDGLISPSATLPWNLIINTWALIELLSEHMLGVINMWLRYALKVNRNIEASFEIFYEERGSVDSREHYIWGRNTAVIRKLTIPNIFVRAIHQVSQANILLQQYNRSIGGIFKAMFLLHRRYQRCVSAPNRNIAASSIYWVKSCRVKSCKGKKWNEFWKI